MSFAEYDFEMENAVKSMRELDIERGGLQLYTTLLDKVIENLSSCSLEEIGSTSWTKKVNAIIMVKNGLEVIPEVGKKLLVQHKKAGVFVRDMITVNIWIQELLPQLVEAIKAKAKSRTGASTSSGGRGMDDRELCKSTILMLLTHGRYCRKVVAHLMRDPSFITSPEHTGLNMDIIDHAIRVVQNFIAKKPNVDPNLNTADSDKKPKTYELTYEDQYEEAKLNLEYLFHLVLKLIELPSDTVVKLLHPSTRLLVTMVDLILTRPWAYICQSAPDFNFLSFVPASLEDNSNWTAIVLRFDPIETMSWQILIEVLVPRSGKYGKATIDFPKDGECADKLLLLKEPLKVKSFVENMPRSYDLKIFLAQVEFVPVLVELKTVAPRHRTVGLGCIEPPLGPPILTVKLRVEVNPPPSPFYEAIRAELLEKKKAILDIHEAMGSFERRSGEDGRNRDRLMEALWNDMNQYCFRCGKSDAKCRCTRCHFAWYCNRKCQSKDWTKHKLECTKGMLPNITYDIKYRGENDGNQQLQRQ